MKKILCLLSCILCLGILLSCNGEGNGMNFSIDSVLNYKCVGGNCLMSRIRRRDTRNA